MELTMKTKFDYKGIRSEFPFLSRKVNQKPIIYLDSAASSQKPQNVIDQLVKTYSLKVILIFIEDYIRYLKRQQTRMKKSG